MKDYSKQNRELKVLKALANANRLKILRVILEADDGQLTVNQIVDAVRLSQPKVSDHLKLMRIAKIVAAKQVSTKMYYRIKEPLVEKIIASLG